MYFECTYRVPYADTDQMGVVYYANYFEYFERGRTEMLRSVGAPYSVLEQEGAFLPVIEAHCDYFGSAKYDDLLTFRSYVESRSRIKLCRNSFTPCGTRTLVLSGRIWRLLPFMVTKGMVWSRSVNTCGSNRRLRRSSVGGVPCFLSVLALITPLPRLHKEDR